MASVRLITSNPYLLLSLTALLWAGNAIAGKFAVGHISPFLLTTFRWLIAFAILLPFAYPYLRRDLRVIRANLWLLVAFGLVGFTLFNNLLYLALVHTTAINVAIEQASMPLVVFGLNFLLFSIRVTALQFFGFMLTLVGVALTVSNGNLTGLAGQPVNRGDALMLLAVLAYGIYSVALVRKPAMHWLSFITVLAGAALIGSIPFTIWELWHQKTVFPGKVGMAIALYTAIFPSIIAQVSWVRGLELIGSNRGGIFINLVPIFVAILAVVFLGEVFMWFHLVSMVLVLGGVWLSQRN